MDASKLIGKLLQIIDEYQQEVSPANQEINPPVDSNHFVQIVDLTGDDRSPCEPANAPNEQYADINSVTTCAGGGVNGPKHPADIRANSVAMYPEFKGFKHYFDMMSRK